MSWRIVSSVEIHFFTPKLWEKYFYDLLIYIWLLKPKTRTKNTVSSSVLDFNFISNSSTNHATMALRYLIITSFLICTSFEKKLFLNNLVLRKCKYRFSTHIIIGIILLLYLVQWALANFSSLMKRTLNAAISISDLQHRLSRFSRLSLADFQPHCLIDLVTGGTLVLFAYETRF